LKVQMLNVRETCAALARGRASSVQQRVRALLSVANDRPAPDATARCGALGAAEFERGTGALAVRATLGFTIAEVQRAVATRIIAAGRRPNHASSPLSTD
jgi:hypothetical protein